MNIEIVLIGNELLIGKIQDTNGQWVIDQIRPFGIEVTRITTIKDDLSEISSTINQAISRNPNFIITSGGLGPTFDDMTSEGVAMGLNPPQKLELHEEGYKILVETYHKRYPNRKEMKPSRKKMAVLPRGSIALSNRTGVAPGILIPSKYTNDTTQIFCLPGVPIELKAIFSDHILPKLIKESGKGNFTQASFTFENIGESSLISIIKKIVDNEEYPEIWIKTHPKTRKNARVELHLTSFSKKESIRNEMKGLYNLLYEYVVNHKGKIIEEHPLE